MFQNFHMARKLLSLDGASRVPLPLQPHPMQLAATCMEGAQLLLWQFQTLNSLESLQLTCVMRSEVQQSPLTVRYQHLFKLTSIGAEISFAEPEALKSWALEHLPYEHFGNGSLVLERSDALVQAYLACEPEQVEELHGVVFQAATRLFSAFADVSIIHDVSL